MKKLLFIQVFVLLLTSAAGQIYQFRGPERDGKFTETGLLKVWPEEGPELLLEVDGIGDGWSSVISNGIYIYVSGKKDSTDVLSCFDFGGNEIWKVAYGGAWDGSFPSTRGTPTIEDNRIYIISGQGELVCLDTETGKVNWKINVDKTYKAEWHVWGVAESPLIVDDKVLCSPAGELTTFVAFDKMTGEEIWKTASTGGQRSYVSPVLRELYGKKYILGASASDLFIVDPEDGEIKASYRYFNPELWQWQPKGMIWANSPIVKDNQIFLSIGYNYPAKMLQVDKEVSSITELYTDTLLDNHHHGLIELDGYIYGSYWIHNNDGGWACLDWNTGKIMYDEYWNSKGEMIYCDGLLYVYIEKTGHVGLVKPDPSGFEVLGSFVVQKGRGPHWSHPYIMDGKLFLRHGDVLLVYDIKDRTTPAL